MLAMMATAGLAASGRPDPCSLSGSLSQSAAPSGGTVTGPTRTVTVPSGNTGVLTLGAFSMGGTVTAQYSKNAAAFTTFTDPTDVTFANGDTLAVRITGAVAGESLEFTVTDKTTGASLGSHLIEAV